MSSATPQPAAFTLHSSPDAGAGVSKMKSPCSQALRLDMSEGVLGELVNSVKVGKLPRLTTGKTPALRYGNRSRHINSKEVPLREELYESSSREKPNGLSLTSLCSHRLEVRDATEATAGADAAMLALQNQMAAIEQQKQSKKTLFVADSSNLPPARSAKRPAVKSTNSTRFFKNNRSQILGTGAGRSIPASPSLGAAQSPSNSSTVHTAISAPLVRAAKQMKTQALRIPLVHLLAVRAASQSELARMTHSPKEDCLQVLQKVGKVSKSAKDWELTDRAYKELDVWTFAYPSQDERQGAIDNAISAFDRMRVSRDDKLWQMLLPKSERGKGVILSKLHLHAGPLHQKGNPNGKLPRSEHPRIPSHGKDGDKTDTRAPTSTAPEAEDLAGLSISSDLNKRKTAGGQQALSKRLLSKKTNKTPTVPIVEARRTSERIETKPVGKIKSAEYVEDSDEDAEMGGTSRGGTLQSESHTQISSSTSTEALETLRIRDKSQRPSPKTSGDQLKVSGLVASKEPSIKPTPSLSEGSGSPHRDSDASQSSRQPSRRNDLPQQNPYKPLQPSPLGSSPPNNTSDMEYGIQPYPASSSSSSPMMNLYANGANTPTNLVNASGSSSRSPPVSQDESAMTLKRKVDGKFADGYGDGSTDFHLCEPPNKRHKPQQSIDSAHIDVSSAPLPHDEILKLGQRFQEYYPAYEKLHLELSRQRHRPSDKMKQLLEMHDRLLTMKAAIHRHYAVKKTNGTM
ncbi:MAG: hypothetical protein M1819_000767 [Sarea resinae]|nr:MAG: hypothetical protein M1819_000767 [Sarea resinae]